MFNKEKIAEYIILNAKGDNFRTNDEWNDPSLKLKFVDAKMLIDRWGNISTDIILHNSKKEFVRNSFGDAIYTTKFNVSGISDDFLCRLQCLIKDYPLISNKVLHLSDKQVQKMEEEFSEINNEELIEEDFVWGAKIHYSDDIDEDVGIMLALDPDTDKFQDEECPGRCIAVFPM